MFLKVKDYFKVAGCKYLSDVDTPHNGSHQHEIGGLVRAGIGQYLGNEDKKFDISFARLEPNAEPIIAEGIATWYDTRRRKSHRGPEWRLYYESNSVTEQLQSKDFFLVAVTHDERILAISCPPDAQIQNQLLSVFNATNLNVTDSFKNVALTNSTIALPITTMFLSLTGINLGAVGMTVKSDLQKMTQEFGDNFPETRKFSEFARQQCSEISALESPDAAIDAYMERENSLFCTLEKHQISSRLRQGFVKANGEADIEGFLRYSLSVQNRRKSRAGKSLENHLSYVFTVHKLKFTAQAITELKKKADFLFPSESAYRDDNFPSASLTMLGAKTTVKDRWRQVLSEANRISNKHLFTMECKISENQIHEMQASNLQLVTTDSIRQTYENPKIREQIWSLIDFIDLVRRRQG